MPLRVGLDVTPAFTTHGGLARYTTELWRELASRGDVAVAAFALGRGRRRATALPLTRVPVPLRTLRPLWRVSGVPRAEWFARDVDLVHSLALMPAPTRKPRVQTVHDVLPISHPELYPPGADDVHRAELAAAADADAVVTTCEATALEIARVSDIPRGRITVAPPGVFARPGGNGAAPMTGPYILAVGQVTPRKGLDVLARAAALVGPRCPPIVVAGPDWWRADEVRARIREVDRDGRVRLLGPVDDDQLGRLYAHATLVCHPSRAEGFGMPCLEAMDAGAPLVASDLPSIRELTAGAAALFSVDEAEALAGELDRLLSHDDDRHALAAAGRRRAGDFSWRRMADEVVSVYRRVRG
jgi:glycosyltransferase involved in cell wall biosynthesis